MKTKLELTFALALLTSAPLQQVFANVTFENGTFAENFNSREWTAHPVGTATVHLRSGASNGNPGAYGILDILDNAGRSPGAALTFLNHDGTLGSPAGPYAYDPSSGAIVSVAASVDLMRHDVRVTTFGDPATYPLLMVTAALMQGGIYYYADSNWHLTDQYSWTTYSDSLTAASYRTATDPNAHPNFSTSGGVIEFGFMVQNIGQGAFAGFFQGHPEGAWGGRIDNWSVTVVNTVPEPSTVIAGALLLLPFGASALRKLRKRRKA